MTGPIQAPGPVPAQRQPELPEALRLRGAAAALGGRLVLEGIDLEVRAGEPVALTGPSGSGKTVLCLVLAGALEPVAGTVLLDDRPLRPGEETTVALVLQTHGLVDGLTAEESVALPMQSRGIARREIVERARGALQSVGLAEHAGRLVDELSGGERQRVGVARALACDPLVLIADEPTAELDADNRERVLALLLDHAARGRIVVIASDDAEVVGACRWVAELYAGRVHAVRPVDAVAATT